jgi:hypothetical protein
MRETQIDLGATSYGTDPGRLAVHPGTVETEMQNQWEDAYPGIAGTLLKKMAIATSRSPEQGAYSGLYAACSDDIVKNKWNGEYFQDAVSPKRTCSSFDGSDTAEFARQSIGTS